jgi:predicted alpha/beta-fold hydrolase
MKSEDVVLQIDNGSSNTGEANTNRRLVRKASDNTNGSTSNRQQAAVVPPSTGLENEFGLFSCCFPTKRNHEINLNECPDDDFYSDNIVRLSNGFTAYRVLEPLKPDSPDPPLIILIHGLQNSSYMWADVAELLADFDQGPLANVLIYDIFGHGRSPWTGKNLSLDVLVTQIKELIEGKLFSSSLRFVS